MAKRINSRTKGKVGELELAHKLSEMFDVQVKRGQQHSGLEGQDVVGLTGVHVECKRVERLQIYAAVEQSVRDAATGDGGVPAVFHRANKQPWLVTVRLSDLPELAVAINKLKKTEDTGND